MRLIFLALLFVLVKEASAQQLAKKIPEVPIVYFTFVGLSVLIFIIPAARIWWENQRANVRYRAGGKYVVFGSINDKKNKS